MSAVELDSRDVENSAERAEVRGKHPLFVVLLVVAALVAGGVVGWTLRGSGDDGGVIVVGGELSDRQAEMVRVGDEMHRAFIAGDGDAVAALFVPQGFMLDPNHDMELRVDDGSLASQINAGPSPSYQVDEPVVVQGDTVIYTGSWGGDWVHVLLFTSSGDVRIIRDTFIQ